ncbi:MAG: ATP-binding protein [Ekhidna sp.]|nr:ATP-binding protein [Ekhidna sp.]
MTMSQQLIQSIEYYTRQLRLPAFRNEYQKKAQVAAEQNHSYEQYLHDLMEIEQQQRIIRRKQERIKRANFPYLKYLNDLVIDDLPKSAQDKLTMLARLDFIQDGRNLILAGNPGTGKTHLAIGLAIKACTEDFKVMFTSIPRLITQIREARSARNLATLENRFTKYDLVICDEFGYISFDKEAAEMLFTHLSLRTGLKSTIITTNLGFDRWNEIFGDEVLTAAMVDRITHKAIMVDMNGKSFRVKETKLQVMQNK